jgi:hypothetical protein|tara:strand:+ start:27 stop:362 length:336 start_codon:yes stop_codon:yes gene_type:complete
MKQIFALIALFVFAIASSQDYTVLHINSSWNFRNDYKDLNKIKGAKIVKALLEEQKQSVRTQIKSVPVIFIYRDRSLIGRWDAGISLSIKAPVQEMQDVIDKSRYTRVATN